MRCLILDTIRCLISDTITSRIILVKRGKAEIEIKMPRLAEFEEVI